MTKGTSTEATAAGGTSSSPPRNSIADAIKERDMMIAYYKENYDKSIAYRKKELDESIASKLERYDQKIAADLEDRDRKITALTDGYRRSLDDIEQLRKENAAIAVDRERLTAVIDDLTADLDSREKKIERLEGEIAWFRGIIERFNPGNSGSGA